VYFDKTQQNISQLGLVSFLLKEPARTAAAVPKCFYFQEDHWRGSVVQSNGKTVIYEFEGHYFFNKATGDGGVWVTDFTVAGQTFDPTSLPGFPPGYGQDFGPGTGGFITHDDVPADPQCVAIASRDPGAVYNQQSATPRCVPDAGAVTRHGLGPVALGSTEDRVRAVLGPPQDVERGFLRYCVGGGGEFMVGQPGDRSGTFGYNGATPAVMVLTTARGFLLKPPRRRPIAVGSSAKALARAFPHARHLARLGRTGLLSPRPGIVAGVARGRIAFLAVYERAAIRRKRVLRGYLRRSR
jgi:hypothetical protein